MNTGNPKETLNFFKRTRRYNSSATLIKQSSSDFKEVPKKYRGYPTIEDFKVRDEDISILEGIQKLNYLKTEKSTNANTPTSKEFKSAAKELKLKDQHKSLGHAQNALAKEYGFKDYNAIRPHLLKKDSIEEKRKNADDFMHEFLSSKKVPVSIQDIIKNLNKNILIEKEEDDAFYFKMLMFLFLLHYLPQSKMDNEEILALLEDKEEGIPQRHEIAKMEFNEILIRTCNVLEKISPDFATRNIIDFDDVCELIDKKEEAVFHMEQNKKLKIKTDFRKMENKNKRKIFY